MTPTSPSSELAPSRGRALARKVGERAASAVVVLWGAATVAFVAQLLLPGDRATVILNIRAGQPQERTPEELAPIIAQFGLDRPEFVQYFDYLRGLVVGDFGMSYQQFRPVTDIIGEQLGATVVALARGDRDRLGAHGGLGHAHRRPRPPRSARSAPPSTSRPPVCRTTGSGIILLLVFALGLHWFPVIGGTGIAGLMLPALTLAIPLAGFLSQAPAPSSSARSTSRS